MIPYYLLNGNDRNYRRLAQDLNQYSRVNTHVRERSATGQPSVSVSDMISSGTLHAVNAVEKGWMRVSSLLRG